MQLVGYPLAPNELPYTILERFWLPSGDTVGPNRVLKELKESPREPKRVPKRAPRDVLTRKCSQNDSNMETKMKTFSEK